jgi:hypothetical protein
MIGMPESIFDADRRTSNVLLKFPAATSVEQLLAQAVCRAVGTPDYWQRLMTHPNPCPTEGE